MTTSLQLAQECLKDNEPNEEETTSQQTFDGLESFAQTIESGTMSLNHYDFMALHCNVEWIHITYACMLPSATSVA